MKYFILFYILLLSSCAGIKYQDDKGFLNSAQANSLEFPIEVDGKVCRDMDGIPGLCSKRWPNDRDLTISIVPLEYAYRYHVSCTKELGIDGSMDVTANKATEISISHDQFPKLVGPSFMCIVEIFPQDRKNDVSAKAEIRVKVLDSKYSPRESAYIQSIGNKKYLVVGQFARNTHLCLDGECEVIVEKPQVDVTDYARVTAWSESFMMRYNYFSTGE